MIKLFRKIRQRLLTENKFSKYLIYAIGEIILVIIGILIALNINNRNLVKQNEAKFAVLFDKIMKDMIIDFEEADRVLKFDIERDSLITLVLNNKVTEEDYTTNPMFGFLITNYEKMLFSENGYNNLTAVIDQVPVKYKEVVDLLNTLNIEYKTSIVRPNNILSELCLENLKKWAKSKPWFSNTHSQPIDSEKLTYFLTDPFYKNDLKLFQIYLTQNHIATIKMYRYQIAKSYTKISKLLELEKQIPELISSYLVDVPENIIQQYTGEYKNTDDDYILKITSDKEGLFMRVDDWKTLLIPKTDSTFVPFDELPIQINFNKNVKPTKLIFISEKGEFPFIKTD
jgi:mRNA-degrading endonuclease RelE of RelBE toxin-antitoxin system